MTQFILLLFVLSFFHSGASYAATEFKFKEDKGSVEGLAIGQPKALKIEIKGPGPGGMIVLKDKKLTGELAVDLSKLTTEIDMRDRHMKEKYLEVEKFKMAKVSIKEVSFPDKWTPKDELNDVAFKGELELHGEKKPVDGKLTYKPKDKEGNISTKFNVKISDFKIATPEFLKIKVTDVVEMTTKSLVQVTDVK